MSARNGKLLIIVIAFGVANLVIPEVRASSFPIVYHRCQGEGCGCAASPEVRSDTVLYSGMSKSSKKVGSLKKGQKARVLESVTIVRKPGLATLTKATPRDGALKVGDKIQLLLYGGEGVWKGSYQDKEMELDESEGHWSIIERPDTEGWFKLGAEKIEGYTQDFPFQGCLE